MYTAEEKKSLRVEFWDQFRKLSGKKRRRLGLPSKWVGEYTGIKYLNLKFHFDISVALVGIDIVTNDLDKRIDAYEKLEQMKKLLEEAMGSAMVWELLYITESGREISRIYKKVEGVDIYDRSCWPAVSEFLYINMINLEKFFLEYKDVF
jgi:hypothetical protein